MKHDTIADVSRDIAYKIGAMLEFADEPEKDDLLDWKHRLEQAIADQGTVPGEVWVYKNTLAVYLREMRKVNPHWDSLPLYAAPPDENRDDYVRVPVHGAPAAESGGCEGCDRKSAGMLGLVKQVNAYRDHVAKTEARAERAEVERDALRERVRELEGSLGDMVDGMKRWGLEEGGIPEMVWSAYRTARNRLGWEEVDEPAPPPTDDGLPKCPKCGARPGVSVAGTTYSCCEQDERHLMVWRTRDEWIRHCAENTPCRKCGDKPDHDNNTREQMTCGCSNWHTPAEWLKRNEVTNENDVIRPKDAGVSGNIHNKKTALSAVRAVAPSDALERAREKMHERADWQAERRVKPHGMSTRMDDAEVASACTAYAVEAILDHLDAVKRGQG